MRRFVALLALLLLSVVMACGSPRGGENPTGSGQDLCGPWGCAQKARFDAAAVLVAGTSGLAVEVTDRATGEVWRAGDSDLRTWGGSMPKLALAIYLLEEQRADRLQLSEQDRADIDKMLAVSDNAAAERLWTSFGLNQPATGAAVMQRWRETYGMTNASYVDEDAPRWGAVKLGVGDLTALVRYVVERLDPADRALVVDRMRNVGLPQQWGVWGAGPQWKPGLKNGWYYTRDASPRWVLATAGFVGADERYLVSALYDEPPGGIASIAVGVHLLTDLVAVIFGAPLPAPAEVPQDP